MDPNVREGLYAGLEAGVPTAAVEAAYVNQEGYYAPGRRLRSSAYQMCTTRLARRFYRASRKGERSGGGPSAQQTCRRTPRDAVNSPPPGDRPMLQAAVEEVPRAMLEASGC